MKRHDELPELVVCAAMRSRQTGKVICGVRHMDEFMRSCVGDWSEFQGAEQGFVTNKFRFVTREEASAIAVANDQVRANGGWNYHKWLFSENLY